MKKIQSVALVIAIAATAASLLHPLPLFPPLAVLLYVVAILPLERYMHDSTRKPAATGATSGSAAAALMQQLLRDMENSVQSELRADVDPGESSIVSTAEAAAGSSAAFPQQTINLTVNLKAPSGRASGVQTMGGTALGSAALGGSQNEGILSGGKSLL